MRHALLRSAFIIIVLTGIVSCGGYKAPGTPTAASPTTTSAATTTVATTTAATTSIGATSLAGTVTEAVSGSPIASATVAVQGKTATTGSDGRYSITGITDGSSAVTAQHQGHRNFTQNTAISGATTVNIVMTKANEATAAGTFTGTWRNDTFGSSGGATLTITVDTVAQTFSGTFDMSGSVFGRGDPAPATFSGPYSTTSGVQVTATSSFYGNVTGAMTSNGSITGSMSNPSPTISRVDYSGTATASAINITYTVRFTDGSTATGTVKLTK
jgi:hypothetical protein